MHLLLHFPQNVSEFLNRFKTETFPHSRSITLLDCPEFKNQKRMENNKQVEVIFFSKYSLRSLDHKQQVRWLGTIAQSAIELQNKNAKKLLLTILKSTPAIYLS